jgi:photosystem II stability/assembly factor-like uncharacterized protein
MLAVPHFGLEFGALEHLLTVKAKEQAMWMRVIGVTMLMGLSAGCMRQPDKARWQPIGLSGGGGLTNPAFSPHDPNLMMTESDMGGRYISHDAGRHWTMIHYKQITSCFHGAPPLFDPIHRHVIYALDPGSILHVSRDEGKTWRTLDDACQPKIDLITQMYMDPVNGRFFLGSQAGKVMFTDDEGKTWTISTGVTGGHVFGFVARSGSDRAYYVGTRKGVFESSDGGRSFVRKVRGLPEGKEIVAFAGGSNRHGTALYVALPCWLDEGKLAGGVYASKDAGESWQRCMNPNINVQTKRTSEYAAADLPKYQFLVANDVDPNVAYVHCAGTSFFPPNHNTIYKTVDAGHSWTETFFVDPRFKEHNVAWDWKTLYLKQSHVGSPISMAISPVDPNVVSRCDEMFIFTTRDGGKTWSADHTIQANRTTDDAKARWLCNGLVNTTTWNYYVDPFQPNRHYICYTDIGFARSLDKGRSWRWWGPGGRPKDIENVEEDMPLPRKWTNTTYELAFDPQTPGKIWGAFSAHHDIPNENSIWRGTGKSSMQGGVAVSTDFGVSWKPLRSGLPEKPVLSIVLDPRSSKGSRTLYASVYDVGVFKSTDDGQSWISSNTGVGDPENMRVCRLFLHKDGTLFVLVTGMRIPSNGPFTDKGVGLYRSKDGAATWERVNATYPLVYPRDYGVDPDDSSVIYIGASDGPGGTPAQGGLHRTTDGGKTWQCVLRKRATHSGVTFSPWHKGWIYATSTGWLAAPEGALWLSKDNGNTWQPLAGMPFAQTCRVHFDRTDHSIIYVTTFGGSVWRGPAD